MTTDFRVGSYIVRPDLNVAAGPNGEIHLEPKVMSVLVLLAERAGEVVTKDEIMRAVWDDVIVSDDALVRCISELRRLLGDNPKEHRVIQTIPKKGYRLVAAIVPLQNAARENRDGATLTLEAVLRASSDYIYIFDDEGHYLRASKSGARALGLASES